MATTLGSVILFSGVGAGRNSSNFTNTVFDDNASTPIQEGSAPLSAIYNPQESLATVFAPTTGGQQGMNVQGTWMLTITNSQVGLGSQVASISQNFTQGELQATGVPSDLAISGNGFFIVQNASQSQLYTRDGAFSLNSNNNLVDTSGDYVMGYGVNPSTFQVNTNNLAPITIPPVGLETIAQATSNASLTGNLNAGGIVATSGTVLTSQALQSSTGNPIDGSTTLESLQSVSSGAFIFSQSGGTLTLSPQQGGRDLPTQTLTYDGSTTVAQLQSFLQDGLAIDPNVPAGTPGPTRHEFRQ